MKYWNQLQSQDIAKRNFSGKAEILFYVDSLAALNIVKAAIKDQSDAKINLLIEIGASDGRAGLRDISLLPEIIEAIKSEPKISVRGVSGFEGAVPGGDRESGVAHIRSFLVEDCCGCGNCRPVCKWKSNYFCRWKFLF
jgi:D-serine deaminase-like pyridoxal phosphate-dependent protein